MNDAIELLRAWAEHGSEDAFAKLVAQHIDLVYSIAVRKVAGDTGLAADVTQIVFADFARKAHSLRAEGSLAGWLHRHTCHVAATALRGELRRRAREQTAATMHALDSSHDPDWSRLAPLLDDAVNALGDADRHAILLRFYERLDLRAVGASLGVGDDAAQKRVTRALEKLRDWLTRRGVTSTTAALTAMISAHSVSAAPAGMAAVVTSAALATAATAATGAGTVTLFEIMTHAKAKLAVAAAAAALVVTPVVWQEKAIARVRSENRALAAHVTTDQVHANQNQIAPAAVAEETTQADRDREELDRLRREVASTRTQLEQVRAARISAAQALAQTPRSPIPKPPGFISLQDARDVGAGTGEALFQTFAWAARTGNTNRLIQLIDWSAEGADKQLADMMQELPKAVASGELERNAADTGFRVLRQVPLPDGDNALVMDMVDKNGETGDNHRIAARIRRVGAEWHLVMGKNGPDEVKLDDSLMGD